MNNKTKLLVLNGLMIALVCMATMVIQIPIPMTEGYVNIGDSIIFVASILFGPISGIGICITIVAMQTRAIISPFKTSNLVLLFILISSNLYFI